MNITVSIFTTDDELNCEVYGFWLDSSRSIIKLQYYYVQSRKTKRHHFRSSKVWLRHDRRGDNIERPVVRECVKTKAIEILLASIKFEEE